MLEQLPRMTVVAEAASGKEAIKQFILQRPDVLLLDLRFPDLCGVEVIRAIREQFLIAKIIVLTACDGDEDVYQSLKAGAKAYLLKDVTLAQLVECIEKVHDGQTCIPASIAAKLAERTASPHLTERELDVLRRIVAGRSNKEIAADLEITEGTVKTHVNQVFDKLGVHDRTNAATTAIKRGLVRQ
jgi:two-component system NarL family response regulator